MNGRWLFDPAPYTEPGAGLWPGIPGELMSDDEAAALLWPELNAPTGEHMDGGLMEVALWRR